MTPLPGSELRRGGVSDMKMRWESEGSVSVRAGNSIVGQERRRGIAFGACISSKGGGTTNISIFLPESDFPLILDAMRRASEFT